MVLSDLLALEDKTQLQNRAYRMDLDTENDQPRILEIALVGARVNFSGHNASFHIIHMLEIANSVPKL